MFRGADEGGGKRRPAGVALIADPGFWSPFPVQQEAEVRKGEVLFLMSVLLVSPGRERGSFMLF